MRCGTLVPRSCLIQKLPNWPHRQSLPAIHAARLGPYPQSRVRLDRNISSGTRPVMSSVTLPDRRFSRASMSCSPPRTFLGIPPTMIGLRLIVSYVYYFARRLTGKEEKISRSITRSSYPIRNLTMRPSVGPLPPPWPISRLIVFGSEHPARISNSGPLTVRRLSDALQHLHDERGNETPRARAVRVRDAKSNAKKEERR